MLISIDWLQLHCSGVLDYPQWWKVVREPYSTRQFKYIDNVYFDNELFCTIVSEPLSSILNPTMLLIKVANSQLYNSTKFITLKHLIDSLKIQVKGISRLDLACDFNEFFNHINPQNLIKRFLSNHYKKVGQSKFKLIGEQKTHLELDYLRFGTGNSLVSSYLYNKTKELAEVHDKAYIRDSWSASGLNVDKTVWRLEFSMKGNQIKLNDENTGELLEFTLENLQDSTFLRSAYLSLVDSYFRFKINDKQKNISRMKDVKLFGGNFMQYKRFIFRELGDGSRADKVFIRKLESVNDELRSRGREKYYRTQELIEEFVTAKGMHDYYISKIQGSSINKIKMLKYKEKTFEEWHSAKMDDRLQRDYDNLAKHNRFYNTNLKLNEDNYE